MLRRIKAKSKLIFFCGRRCLVCELFLKCGMRGACLYFVKVVEMDLPYFLLSNGEMFVFDSILLCAVNTNNRS